ncbi:polyphosphate kinase 2 family protein [Pollutibacter soli]|uniref:polyphosphate kinase 2 family protein n=1 Tax=Pollutibacter soli TaxID=3034157 RepID=UPI003013ECB6
MTLDSILHYIDRMIVKPGQKVSLNKFATDYDHDQLDKPVGEALLKLGIQKLSELQDVLYAENKYRVLIVLQAMDAAGKDGAIKHVMSGLNPQGVKVHSFKTPSTNELDHDYLWRHELVLPARGEIGIFNRSHYENVLVTRVHPEFILNENIPGINSVQDIDDEFWERRMNQINRFEKNLQENGMVIMKFFLHLSKKEQKKRFIERIDDKTKNWKFSASDLHERVLWDKYMGAYEKMLTATSTKKAPWYVIPADDKWFSRLAIAAVIYRTLEKLDMKYPQLNAKQMEDLKLAKEALMKEKK